MKRDEYKKQEEYSEGNEIVYSEPKQLKKTYKVILVSDEYFIISDNGNNRWLTYTDSKIEKDKVIVGGEITI